MSELASKSKYKRYYQNLEPLFKSRQNQAYLMVVISLFTIAFFGYFAVKPTLITITSLQRQIEDKKLVSQKLETKINSLVAAEAEYQKIKDRLGTVYNFMPNQADFPVLLRQLERTIMDNQLTVNSLTFDQIIIYDATSNRQSTASSTIAPDTAHDFSKNEYATIKFNLSLGGDYPKLIKFLEQLTRMDRLVTIVSSTLDGGKSQQSGGNLSLTLETKAYYFKDL